jgi:uncharacterized protein CbrC (UPF0167 family)
MAIGKSRLLAAWWYRMVSGKAVTKSMGMITFDELGMPFGLFEAPVSSAEVDSTGGPCAHCKQPAKVLFEGACYACFRAGLAQHTMDTVYGMVRPEDAARGLTHGIPLADPATLSGCELVAHPVDPKFPDEKWYSVRIDANELVELTRTPAYHSWQGERWQFCCSRPCVFIGEWPHAQWVASAQSAGVSLDAYLATVFRIPDLDDAEELGFCLEEGVVGNYVFRCRHCGKLLAHYDRT